MTYILIVAGTALALCVASLLIIERETPRHECWDGSELRAPGHKPGASPFYVGQSKLVTVSNNVRFTPESRHVRCTSDVRFVPIADYAPQQTASLFDHLVGAGEQLWSNGEAQCLRGLEVDD